jgi:hypothetical protein
MLFCWKRKLLSLRRNDPNEHTPKSRRAARLAGMPLLIPYCFRLLTCDPSQRRVKCGEQRPSCLQCTKGRRICPGYQKPKIWLFETSTDNSLVHPQQALSTTPNQNPETYRAFQYYFEVSEPPLVRFFAAAMAPLFQYQSRAGDVDQIASMFWAVTFPRLVCSEPVLAKCLLVVVTSHEKVQTSNNPFALEPECLERFLAAITLLRSEWNNMSVDSILVASMLLAIAELSFGPSTSGLSHLYAGHKIIRQRRAHPEDYAHHRAPPDIDGIREPIELLYESFLSCQPNLIVMDDFQPQPAEVPRFWLPLKFSSTQQALGSLESLTTTAQRIVSEKSVDVVDAERISLRQNAERWLGAFQDLESEINGTADPEFVKACLIIRINGLSTLIKSSLPESELDYDAHEIEFRQIAEFAEEFLKVGGGLTQSVKAHLMFGIGPVNQLFFAATKCRFPLLRYRLLQALRKLKVVEGQWTSCAAYQIAEQVKEIESCSTKDQTSSDIVPWSDRITIRSITFNGAGLINLKYEKAGFSNAADHTSKSLPIQACRHQGYLNQVCESCQPINATY